MSIVADWIFSSSKIKSGSISNGNLVISDASGNNNDLELVTYGDKEKLSSKECLKWSTENFFNDNTIETLEFSNNIKSGICQYFKTVDQAVINKLKFENGYTIEAILQLPKYEYDPWMGILTREGSACDINKLNGEKELLTTLSYNEMFQWTSHPTNLDYNLTNWSISRSQEFRGGFIYVTIVNNGENTILYINGITDIRNPKEKTIGIDLVEGKGWLIGAAEWDNKLSGMFSGKLERIRIADTALEKQHWLIQEPTPVMVLEGSDEAVSFLNHESNYNFVFIPDSQYMCESAPHMVDYMTRWVKENHNKYNIKFLGHLGDITEESTEEQYILGDNAFKDLDDVNLTYLVTPGNHDLRFNGENFKKYFGLNRYINNKQKCGGASDNLSVYTIVEAGSYKYLIISLDYSKIEGSINWAKEVIEEYKNMPTIIMTHDAYNVEYGKFVRTENGEYIWRNLVASTNQIFMVVAGHEFDIYHREMPNNYGNKVIEMLVNYQVYPAGGNGWMRLLEFDELKNTITANTYSPWVDSLKEEDKNLYDHVYLTSSVHKFTIDFKFEERFN